MVRFKNSINRKFTLLLFTVLLLTSLVLSISFYFISMSTIDSYVMPQINKLLTAAAQDSYKGMNATYAQQTLNKSEQAATNLEYYFRDKKNSMMWRPSF